MASALLLLLVGIFILLNSPNFVKVLRGEAQIKFLGGEKQAEAETDIDANAVGSGAGVEIRPVPSVPIIPPGPDSPTH